MRDGAIVRVYDDVVEGEVMVMFDSSYHSRKDFLRKLERTVEKLNYEIARLTKEGN